MMKNNFRFYITGFLFIVLLSGCATAGKASRGRAQNCREGDFKICVSYSRWDKNIRVTFAWEGDSLYKIYSVWNPKYHCKGEETVVGETYHLYLYPLYDESECKDRDIADMFNLEWLALHNISPDCCVRNVFIATNICNDYIINKPRRFIYRQWRHFEEPDRDLPFPETSLNIILI